MAAYGSLGAKRRAELRKVAQAQIASLEQQAIVRIEQASVEAQTQIAITGLTSEAAHAFVEQLPSSESLMPALSYRDIAGESEPLIVEQLLAPNILGVSRSEGTRFCLSRPEGSRAPAQDKGDRHAW